MFQRLVLTISTAICLTGMYLVYSAVMRPIVVIPDMVEQQLEKDDTDVQQPVENTRVAGKYLPSWPTATASKYMLRADDAFVYTNEWKPVDDENNRRVLFKPFAMVWLSKNKEGLEQAISVVSDSAMLEFASTFDGKNQNPGRIIGAVLHGDVDLAGPDGLLVQGSDFHFEEQGLTLYTHNPVRFWYMAHEGAATRMEMKLIPAEGPPGNDRPHVYGIESIHLSGRPNQDEYVWLKMQMPQGRETRTIHARCSGELVYTVATNTAVLTTDVIAQTTSNPRYKLECTKLTMQFVPKESPAHEAKSDPPNDPSHKGDFQKIEADLEFSWMEALSGKNAPVKIRSKSNGLTATMARLTYSEETRTVYMSSEDSAEDVEVIRFGSRLKVPRIKIDLDHDKKNVVALNCLGKGLLKYFDEATGRLTYIAEWENHLRKITDPATQLDLVELDGNAQFRQPKPNKNDSSGLLAQRIKIWLEPMPVGLPGDNETNDSSSTPDPEPKRILAERQVALTSPQLLIDRTDELDIVFEEAAGTAHVSMNVLGHDGGDSLPLRKPEATRQKLRSQLQPAGYTLLESKALEKAPAPRRSQVKMPSEKSPHHQIGFASVRTDPLGTLGPPVDIPSISSSGKQRKNAGALSKPNGRTSVSADRIEVHVRRSAGSQEMQPRTMLAQGKVKISQERQPGERPLTLVGDRVDMKIETPEKLVAHVQGAPALIRDQKFEIEGKNLHLDRGENLAWVDGTGLLKLPIPADREIPGLDPAASRDLVVRWDESMNFNGSQAEFEGNVEAKLGHAKMTCGRMIAQLVRPISFQKETIESEPALKTIHCRERVKFENSTYKGKNLIEVYRGRVGDFTLNYLVGTVEAQGPGEVFAWQRHDKNGGIASREAIQANRPITTEVTVWDYTHLQFEGLLKGQFDGQNSDQPTRQSFTVYDRVEIVYGPVKWTIEQIDPDDLPSKSGTMRCGKLEFVNHPVSKRNPTAYREFVGRENAEVEGQVDGRRYTASADEISYDESKGLFMLRAHGRQNARLTRIGSGTWMGRSVKFNPDPKLNLVEVERAVEIQGSQ